MNNQAQNRDFEAFFLHALAGMEEDCGGSDVVVHALHKAAGFDEPVEFAVSTLGWVCTLTTNKQTERAAWAAAGLLRLLCGGSLTSEYLGRVGSHRPAEMHALQALALAWADNAGTEELAQLTRDELPKYAGMDEPLEGHLKDVRGLIDDPDTVRYVEDLYAHLFGVD